MPHNYRLATSNGLVIKQTHSSLTTTISSEPVNAFDDETSKIIPTAATIRSRGSSISLVGEG